MNHKILLCNNKFGDRCKKLFCKEYQTAHVLYIEIQKPYLVLYHEIRHPKTAAHTSHSLHSYKEMYARENPKCI